MLEFAKHTKLHYFIDNEDPSRSEDLIFQIMVFMLDSKNCIRYVKTNGKKRELDSTGAVSGHKRRAYFRSCAIRYALKYFKKETTIMKIYRYKKEIAITAITAVSFLVGKELIKKI